MSDRPILLIQDTEEDALLIQRACRKLQWVAPIAHVRQGEDGLKFLETTEPGPRLVLVDLNLPGDSGLEILRRIRQHPRWKGYPVAILTGSSSAGDREAAMAAGANAFITLPVAIEELIDSLRVLDTYALD